MTTKLFGQRVQRVEDPRLLTGRGRYLDDLGLRGFRIGTAQVSDKHANFVQADEGGSAADVRAVIEAVRSAVETARGIALRSEVRLVGFGDEA